ncbi:glycoside hydrolase [Amylocarpus encephaloides]|uniref:lytic cellulose monooxygenase (C4-dehydrogenating) n=1 Tax=Amylocarpus encephaloides TaxID=45428 RepID=A0A9P8C5A7_9HELO|nr:glycoside hydrolase [Amylocarpus encephaloides]
MKLTLLIVLQSSLIVAHYTFKSISLPKTNTNFPTWQYLRRWNSQVWDPVIDDIWPIYNSRVESIDIRCNVNATSAPDTLTIRAGEELSINVPYTISHPGPLMAYLARVPDGKTAVNWEGDGEVNGDVDQAVGWPNYGKSSVSFTIPLSTPSGEYLFRVEHIGLQTAANIGSQHFVSCAQIEVAGGGLGVPGPKTAFPGAYSLDDEVFHVNLYVGLNETTYLKEPYVTRTPGPVIWKG